MLNANASDTQTVSAMARDNTKSRNFNAAPVDDYRRKIGHHDKKAMQKEIKQNQRQTEKKRNFGQSFRQAMYVILGILGIVIIVSCIVYGALVQRTVSSPV